MESFASQHTQSFAEFLRQARLTLVVSTYQAGQLVLFRPQGEGVNTHFVAMRRPMGIAVRGGQDLSVGDAHSIHSYRNLPAVGRKLEEGGDAAYLLRRSHVTGDIDVHEMVYADDGELWFINTRMSCLCTLSADASFVPRWKPPFITQYDLLDRCHLNGLGLRDGQPRYVSMLGASDQPGGWRSNKTGGGQIMDLTDNRVLIQGLCMPHSPRWYRDQLWFLSSGEGALKRVDAHGRVHSVVEVPGFARGLAFFGRYALIGLSQVRETAVFAGLPLTQRVTERRSGVYLVDIEAGTVVGFLHFTGDVREIFDVQLLPWVRPSVVETDAAILASSYELPEAAVALVAPPDPLQEGIAQASRAHASGRLDEAESLSRQVLLEDANHPQALKQLAHCLSDAGQWQQASEVWLQLVAVQPSNAEALNLLGLSHARLQHFDLALEYYERAIAVDQQYALAHFNRAVVLLKLGRWSEGWRAYEWRWQLPQFVPFRCPQPQWQGEDISGQRLLVHSEQGNGDHIQFWRYLKLARQRCRELIYVGPESLAELAAGVEGVDESRPPGSLPRDRFDVFVPLMSLPACLGLSEPEPMTQPYVRLPAHAQVRQLAGDVRIGILWQGSPTHVDDARRSLPLSGLLPPCQGLPAQIYSLQYPLAAGELDLLRAYGIENLEPELAGYTRTAAFVAQMDLIISVDTATAHLAGAMGKPVYLLLAPDADWRWGLHSETTHWYPQMQLWRRAEDEDWTGLLRRLRVALEKRVAGIRE